MARTAAAATADEAAEREGMGGTDAVSAAAGVPREQWVSEKRDERVHMYMCEQRRKERRVLHYHYHSDGRKPCQLDSDPAQPPSQPHLGYISVTAKSRAAAAARSTKNV